MCPPEETRLASRAAVGARRVADPPAEFARRRNTEPSADLARLIEREVVEDRKQRPARRGDVGTGDAADRDRVDLRCQRDEPALERTAASGQEHVLLAAVTGHRPPHDVAERFHRLERSEGRRLHYSGFLGELALRQSVFFPQRTQKGPVTDRYPMSREPNLQRAIE